MKKLMKKSGFTLVEMIVVIAIMGIMLAIVIPIFSTIDARKDEVREYARSFYSNVQELMIDEKLAKNPLPGGSTTKYVLVAAKVDENKASYNDVLIYMSYTANTSSPLSFTPPIHLEDSDPSDNKVTIASASTAAADYKAYEEFATSLRKLLLDNERTGWYYAVVDDKYRVVSAYFVSGESSDYEAIKSAEFSSDKMVSLKKDEYAGAWPEELSDKGTKMFALS